MSFKSVFRNIVFAVSTSAMLAFSPAYAQDDISDEHLAQAREALTAIGATNDFDSVLPATAFALKEQLVQKDPNLIDLISEIVDEETIKLAPRRGDIEREAALAYARVFTQEELKAISDFYESPAGKKLITDGPIATREMIKAGEIWQTGIARDLAEAVGKRLDQETGSGSTPLQERPSE